MNGVWIGGHIALWLIVGLEAVCIIGLLRLVGGLAQRIDQHLPPDQLDRGAKVVDRAVVGLSGERSTFSELWQGGRLLLFFVSSGCQPCRDLLSQYAALNAAGLEVGSRACVLCLDHPMTARQLAGDTGLPPSVLVAAVAEREQDEMVRTYGASVTPTLVVVDANGRVEDVVVGAVDGERLRQIAAPLPTIAAAD